MSTSVTVVGGGLAGCEAALSLATSGHWVSLVEMRPVRSAGAHQSDSSGELVCTNSLKSEAPPPPTMLGGLYRYLSEAPPGRFQPMNSNWGLLDPLPTRAKDRKKNLGMLAEPAQADFLEWVAGYVTPRR